MMFVAASKVKLLHPELYSIVVGQMYRMAEMDGKMLLAAASYELDLAHPSLVEFRQQKFSSCF